MKFNNEDLPRTLPLIYYSHNRWHKLLFVEVQREYYCQSWVEKVVLGYFGVMNMIVMLNYEQFRYTGRKLFGSLDR